MTPQEFFYCWIGLILGIGLMGMLAGLVIIRSDRPKRNCDVGTPVEQYYRFENYCAEHADLEGYDRCKGCPLEGEMNAHDCRFIWLNMPYKKEEDK